MRIVFVTKKKRKKYIELIHKFINKSMLSYDFNLAEEGVNLIYELFGIKGLNLAKNLVDEEIEILEKEIKESEEILEEKIEEKFKESEE